MRLREVAGVWARVGVSDPCQVEQHSAGACDDRTQGAAQAPPTRGRVRLGAMIKQCGVRCRHQLSSKVRDTFGVGWEEEPRSQNVSVKAQEKHDVSSFTGRLAQAAEALLGRSPMSWRCQDVSQGQNPSPDRR